MRLALCYAFDQNVLQQDLSQSLAVKVQPDGARAPRLRSGDSLLSVRSRKRPRPCSTPPVGSSGGRARSRNGKPLAIAISTVAGVKSREELEVLLQRYWRATGIDVTV